MASPPQGAINIEGFSDYGVDENGEWMFFGFKLTEKKFVDLIANYHQLGASIIYLQAIAREAEQRRLTKNPHAGDLEAKGKPSNPVRILDLVPNLEGTSALLTCTTSTGTPIEAQIPFDLIEGMYANLPQLVGEMKKRQQAKGQPH
jgi:hypothetical protein